MLSSSLFFLSFVYLDVFYRYTIRTNNIMYLRCVIIMSTLNMATRWLVFAWDHIPDKAWLRIYQLCTLCTNITYNLIGNGYYSSKIISDSKLTIHKSYLYTLIKLPEKQFHTMLKIKTLIKISIFKFINIICNINWLYRNCKHYKSTYLHS